MTQGALCGGAFGLVGFVLVGVGLRRATRPTPERRV